MRDDQYFMVALSENLNVGGTQDWHYVTKLIDQTSSERPRGRKITRTTRGLKSLIIRLLLTVTHECLKKKKWREIDN